MSALNAKASRKEPLKHLLLIDGYGDYLGLEGSRLVLKQKGGDTLHFPLDELEAVVLGKAGASVSTSALKAFIERGIGLSILHQQREGVSVSPKAPRRLALQRAQYRWRESGVGEQLARRVIKDKLTITRRAILSVIESEHVTTCCSKDKRALTYAESKLSALLQELSEHPEGFADYERKLFSLEAAGARLWWGVVGRLLPEELGFESRKIRGDEPCAFNAALNYGYAILSARLTHLLTSLGFEVGVAFLHADSDGRASLTYDVIERYRLRYVDAPLIRYARQKGAWSLNDDGQLEREVKREVADVVLSALNPRERGGLAVCRAELEQLRRALLKGEPWSPQPLPRRVSCL